METQRKIPKKKHNLNDEIIDDNLNNENLEKNFDEIFNNEKKEREYNPLNLLDSYLNNLIETEKPKYEEIKNNKKLNMKKNNSIKEDENINSEKKIDFNKVENKYLLGGYEQNSKNFGIDKNKIISNDFFSNFEKENKINESFNRQLNRNNFESSYSDTPTYDKYLNSLN